MKNSRTMKRKSSRLCFWPRLVSSDPATQSTPDSKKLERSFFKTQWLWRYWLLSKGKQHSNWHVTSEVKPVWLPKEGCHADKEEKPAQSWLIISWVDEQESGNLRLLLTIWQSIRGKRSGTVVPRKNRDIYRCPAGMLWWGLDRAVDELFTPCLGNETSWKILLQSTPTAPASNRHKTSVVTLSTGVVL